MFHVLVVEEHVLASGVADQEPEALLVLEEFKPSREETNRSLLQRRSDVLGREAVCGWSRV